MEKVASVCNDVTAGHMTLSTGAFLLSHMTVSTRASLYGHMTAPTLASSWSRIASGLLDAEVVLANAATLPCCCNERIECESEPATMTSTSRPTSAEMWCL